MLGKLRGRGRLLVLALVAVAVAATPATASAAECATGPTSQPFASFGDLGDYFLAPNGGFEQELTWAVSGSVARVLGNEPYMLAGLGDRYALRLGKGGAVTTPTLCVSREMPHLRFVARASGSGQLDVRVSFYENGRVTDSSSGSVSPSRHATWAPSRLVDLKVDRLQAGQTGSVTVSFRSQGDWLVDDVFIDPYRRS
jgi:hypothetical protein